MVMLKYALLCQGGGRTVNEDAVKIASAGDKHCFVVCDGLGGHGLGDVASETVTNTLANDLFFCSDMQNFLTDSFRHAQKNVLEKQKESGTKNKMKTTAVALATDGEQAFVGYVGDSRLYAFRHDGAYVRTMDHSVPQILVNSQTIAEHEIRNHPSRNMLLIVIGEQYDEELCDQWAPFAVRNYSAYLLCTDGFWELVQEAQMLETLKVSTTPQQWLEKMEQILLQVGEGRTMDNYSAIAVFTA